MTDKYDLILKPVIFVCQKIMIYYSRSYFHKRRRKEHQGSKTGFSFLLFLVSFPSQTNKCIGIKLITQFVMYGRYTVPALPDSSEPTFC